MYIYIYISALKIYNIHSSFIQKLPNPGNNQKVCLIGEWTY